MEADQMHPRWRHEHRKLLCIAPCPSSQAVFAPDVALHPVAVHVVTVARELAERERAAGAVAAEALDACAVVLVQADAAVK